MLYMYNVTIYVYYIVKHLLWNSMDTITQILLSKL